MNACYAFEKGVRSFIEGLDFVLVRKYRKYLRNPEIMQQFVSQLGCGMQSFQKSTLFPLQFL